MSRCELLDAMVQSCAAWRKAEKRWAAMSLGEISGDLYEALDTEQKKLHELRIAFDKWEASNDQAQAQPPTATPERKGDDQ